MEEAMILQYFRSLRSFKFKRILSSCVSPGLP
ncbi:uncharacterized protein G2W53_011173 [Senna tora]|uniref:Uncharacterized protein n=1 Tax=Senna tora TaxID=362788 RepID=A0A834X1Q1_9FABA|nr:uncharacterized protein G2W53_011173 [Senna tora]